MEDICLLIVKIRITVDCSVNSLFIHNQTDHYLVDQNDQTEQKWFKGLLDYHLLRLGYFKLNRYQICYQTESHQ
jgi:hypothetical protein